MSLGERVSDCCLTPNEQYFSYIMARKTHFRWDHNDGRDQYT